MWPLPISDLIGFGTGYAAIAAGVSIEERPQAKKLGTGLVSHSNNSGT